MRNEQTSFKKLVDFFINKMKLPIYQALSFVSSIPDPLPEIDSDVLEKIEPFIRKDAGAFQQDFTLPNIAGNYEIFAEICNTNLGCKIDDTTIPESLMNKTREIVKSCEIERIGAESALNQGARTTEMEDIINNCVAIGMTEKEIKESIEIELERELNSDLWVNRIKGERSNINKSDIAPYIEKYFKDKACEHFDIVTERKNELERQSEPHIQYDDDYVSRIINHFSEDQTTPTYVYKISQQVGAGCDAIDNLFDQHDAIEKADMLENLPENILDKRIKAISKAGEELGHKIDKLKEHNNHIKTAVCVNNHWIALDLDLENQQIKYFDSLPNSDVAQERAKDSAEKILDHLKKREVIKNGIDTKTMTNNMTRVNEAPLQCGLQDSNTCGVFVTEYLCGKISNDTLERGFSQAEADSFTAAARNRHKESIPQMITKNTANLGTVIADCLDTATSVHPPTQQKTIQR